MCQFRSSWSVRHRRFASSTSTNHTIAASFARFHSMPVPFCPTEPAFPGPTIPSWPNPASPPRSQLWCAFFLMRLSSNVPTFHVGRRHAYWLEKPRKFLDPCWWRDSNRTLSSHSLQLSPHLPTIWSGLPRWCKSRLPDRPLEAFLLLWTLLGEPKPLMGNSSHGKASSQSSILQNEALG